MIVKKSDTRRFWAKVLKTDGCWLWTGAKTSAGYGNFWIFKNYHLAHRVSYRLLVGEIPEGLTLDHLKDVCGNRHCVNPAHLEPVTQGENVRRGGNAQKTHCPNDHEYTAENTIILATGARKCRICNRASSLRSYHRHQRSISDKRKARYALSR